LPIVPFIFVLPTPRKDPLGEVIKSRSQHNSPEGKCHPVWLAWVFCVFIAMLPCPATVLAQPISSFTIDPTGCQRQMLRTDNQSTGYASFEWDFCEGDMEAPIAVTDVLTAATSVSILDIKTVQDDDGNWYSFVVDADLGEVFRLDYGTSIKSTPALVPMDRFGLPLQFPSGIEIFKWQGVWYGIVGNFGDSRIFLLTFGNSLANSATGTEIILPPGTLSQVRSIRVVEDDGILLAFVASWSNDAITRINFGATIDPLNVVTDNFSLTGGLLIGLAVAQDNVNKFLFVTNYSAGQIMRFDFGASWTSVPTGDVVVSALAEPTMVQAEFERGNWYLVSTTQAGALTRYDFGPDLSSVPSPNAYAPISDLTTNRGFSLVRSEGHYYGLLTSYATKKLYRVDFEMECAAAQPLFTSQIEPVNSFTAEGDYPVTLRVKGDGLMSDATTTMVQISALVSPEISMTAPAAWCAGSIANFDATADMPITSWNWDFGDGQSAPGQNVTHAYASSGDYVAELTVTADNTCPNFNTLPIAVFQAPAADFLAPAVAFPCTDAEYLFTNQSTFDPASDPQWQWYIDGVPETNAFDLVRTFETTGARDISLSVTIAGCSSEMELIFDVQSEGPQVNIDFSGICENSPTQFGSEVVGAVETYSWTFGDGAVSADPSPAHTYSAEGAYQAELVVVNEHGCQNSAITPITIYSQPEPEFALDLPPFSCAGTPSQFHDLTPPPTDSNLETWNWDFGDGSTSTMKDALNTYEIHGPYDVSLSVVTDRGCAAVITQAVTISQSPVVDFTYNIPCVDQTTIFSPAPTTGISHWSWRIGTTIFTSQNPEYVFTESGSYDIELLATAANNCVATVSHVVIVPIRPTIDIEATNACATQQTEFDAVVSGSPDLPTGYEWTLNNESIGNAPGIAYTFPDAGSYSLTVEVTTASACVYGYSENVAINVTPVAAFDLTEEYGEAPFTIETSNTSADAASYLWMFGDPSSATSTEPAPQFTYTELGNYEIILEANGLEGCMNSTSKMVYVIVPAPEIALEGLQLVAESGSNLTYGVIEIRNNSNFTIKSFDAVIDVGAGALLTERISGNVLPGASASFALSTGFTQRSDQAYLCVNLVVPGDNNESNNRLCELFASESVTLAAWPNPTGGNLSIDFIAAAAEEVSISLTDSRGALVYDKNILATTGLNSLLVDVTGEATGIYYLRVTGPSIALFQKVVIVK
jgi:PKD repeat protein